MPALELSGAPAKCVSLEGTWTETTNNVGQSTYVSQFSKQQNYVAEFTVSADGQNVVFRLMGPSSEAQMSGSPVLEGTYYFALLVTD